MKRYAKTESVNFCQWTVCHFHMSQFVDYTKTQWSNQCLCNRDSLTNLFFRVTLSSVVFMLIVYLRKYTKTRDLKKWVEIGICLNHCFDSFSQLKEFQGTLIEMFKEVFKSEKNPAWMFCLPLLHLCLVTVLHMKKYQKIWVIPILNPNGGVLVPSNMLFGFLKKRKRSGLCKKFLYKIYFWGISLVFCLKPYFQLI